MPDDPISAALAPVRERQAKAKRRTGDAAEAIGAAMNLAHEDVPRLLAAVDKVLARHACATLYLSAPECEHPWLVDDGSPEWQEWNANHPAGKAGRVCLLTPLGTYCPECTRLAAGGREPLSDDYVPAPCATRSDILAALTGERENGAEG